MNIKNLQWRLRRGRDGLVFVEEDRPAQVRERVVGEARRFGLCIAVSGVSVVVVSVRRGGADPRAGDVLLTGPVNSYLVA